VLSIRGYGWSTWAKRKQMRW